MKKENLIFDDISAKIKFYESLWDELKIRHSRWSNFEVTDFNQIPYPNIHTIYYDGGWGKEDSVKVKKSLTWAQIWKACDKLIEKSGDTHHIFIEKFYVKDGVLSFTCGS